MKINAAQRIARALIDASVTVVTNVPGYGGTQVFDLYCALSSQPSVPFFHEEVAYTVAHGASLVGKRAATVVKAHGLAKAANSVVDSLSAGSAAGFVILVFEDKQGKHSDSILDAAAFLHGLRVPYRIPSMADIYEEVLHGFKRSEEAHLPIALLIDTDDLAEEGTFVSAPLDSSPRGFVRNIAQHVLCPLLAGYQDQVLDAKRSFGKWRSITPPAFPRIPDELPPEWQDAVRAYQPFFDAFREVRGDVVSGDTGVSSLFCFPPYSCVDMCTYMGGSIPLALGAWVAGYHNVWAVTGDFSFIAAGHLGLIEARRREIPLKVIVFYNRQAQTTGGQPIAPGIMEAVLEAYEPYLVTIRDPFDRQSIAATLAKVKEAKELQTVVVEYDHP